MSLKAIKEMSRRSVAGLPTSGELDEQVMEEIEALEKAAEHFVGQNLYPTLSVSDEFVAFMETIAKEAK